MSKYLLGFNQFPSLKDLSSSVVLWRYSSLARSSPLSTTICAAVAFETAPSSPGYRPSIAAASGDKEGAVSSMIRKRGDSGDAPGPVVTGRTVRLTVVKWPLVFTRNP